MKTFEDYDSRSPKHCMCKKCKEFFKFEPDECWWDEKGMGYSTKLVKCKHCGCINVVKYIDDYGFNNMNYDSRLYNYKKY